MELPSGLTSCNAIQLCYEPLFVFPVRESEPRTEKELVLLKHMTKQWNIIRIFTCFRELQTLKVLRSEQSIVLDRDNVKVFKKWYNIILPCSLIKPPAWFGSYSLGNSSQINLISLFTPEFKKRRNLVCNILVYLFNDIETLKNSPITFFDNQNTSQESRTPFGKLSDDSDSLLTTIIGSEKLEESKLYIVHSLRQEWTNYQGSLIMAYGYLIRLIFYFASSLLVKSGIDSLEEYLENLLLSLLYLLVENPEKTRLQHFPLDINCFRHSYDDKQIHSVNECSYLTQSSRNLARLSRVSLELLELVYKKQSLLDDTSPSLDNFRMRTGDLIPRESIEIEKLGDITIHMYELSWLENPLINRKMYLSGGELSEIERWIGGKRLNPTEMDMYLKCDYVYYTRILFSKVKREETLSISVRISKLIKLVQEFIFFQQVSECRRGSNSRKVSKIIYKPVPRSDKLTRPKILPSVHRMQKQILQHFIREYIGLNSNGMIFLEPVHPFSLEKYPPKIPNK